MTVDSGSGAAATVSEAHVELAYDGEALRDGTMNIETLAPAMLGVASLCKRANDILNRGATTITVNVHSDFRTGSFGLDIDVIQKVLEHGPAVAVTAGVLFSPEGLKTAAEIAKTIGLIATGDEHAFSLLNVIKWLRGNKIKAAEKSGENSFTYENVAGDKIIVNGDVHNLIMNKDVRQAAHQALRPLEEPGIDVFRINDDSAVRDAITKEAMPFFELDDALPHDLNAEEVLSDSTSDRTYVVVKPSFNPKLTWRLSDGQHEFDAHMEDKNFALEAARGDLAFRAGTLLSVSLRVTSYRSPNGRLSTEYKILKVYSTRPPDDKTQIPLLS